MKNLNAEDWRNAINTDQDAVLIDVRTSDENVANSIPESINLDIFNLDEFMFGIESLDINKTYYVYCRSGMRSLNACRIMNEKGFNAVNLQGGMIAWNTLETVE